MAGARLRVYDEFAAPEPATPTQRWLGALLEGAEGEGGLRWRVELASLLHCGGRASDHTARIHTQARTRRGGGAGGRGAGERLRVGGAPPRTRQSCSPPFAHAQARLAISRLWPCSRGGQGAAYRFRACKALYER